MAGVRSANQVAAAERARVEGRGQAQALQSPLIKRSELLSRMLAQQQEPGNIQGYGELAARLLAQGLTQAASEKTNKAVGAQASNADLQRRQRLARAVGGSVDGAPQEVGNGRLGNPLSGLANLLRRPDSGSDVAGAAQAAPVQPAPQVAPSVPSEGVTQPAMPIPAEPLAPSQPAMPQAQPVPASQVAQQPAARPNPLGPSDAERALVLQYLNSGDPSQVAQAEQMIQAIQARAAEPAALRQEVQMINGVPYLIDPQGGGARPVFQGGLPQETRTQDVFNPNGLRSGSFAQRDPTGKLTVIDEPPEGFEAAGGRLQPIAGGPQDPAAGGNAITNERNLRGEFQRDTSAYRDARQGLAKVQAAANDSSGASDVALIFGFMKTLDPTSTVREGEFATAQNTGSVPERILSAYNRAIAGDRLTDTQRDEFVRSAVSQFSTYEQGYQRRLQEYEGMASRYGLDPANIVGEAARDNRQPAQRRPAARTQPRPAARGAVPPPPPGFELD